MLLSDELEKYNLYTSCEHHSHHASLPFNFPFGMNKLNRSLKTENSMYPLHQKHSSTHPEHLKELNESL